MRLLLFTVVLAAPLLAACHQPLFPAGSERPDPEQPLSAPPVPVPSGDVFAGRVPEEDPDLQCGSVARPLSVAPALAVRTSHELPPPPAFRTRTPRTRRPEPTPARPVSRPAPRAPAPSRRSTGQTFQVDLPLSTALEEARQAGLPVLLYFRSQRCGWCDRLARDTFPRAAVRARLTNGFVAVKYDAGRSPGRELTPRFSLPGYPVMIVLDSSGRELGRIVGYRDAAGLLAELRRY